MFEWVNIGGCTGFWVVVENTGFNLFGIVFILGGFLIIWITFFYPYYDQVFDHVSNIIIILKIRCRLGKNLVKSQTISLKGTI